MIKWIIAIQLLLNTIVFSSAAPVGNGLEDRLGCLTSGISNGIALLLYLWK